MTYPASRGTRTLSARPVAVRRPRNGHVESGLGETGIDLRIVTGFPESERERDATGSGPKTATGHAVTSRGWTAIETNPASDALDRLTASGKQRESKNDRTGHESWPTESGLYDSFFAPRSEDRETWEDREWERTLKDSPDSPCRRACCDEQGEATEEAARAGGVRCGRATSPFPAPKGAKEAEARSRAPDEQPETLPPLSLDRGRAGGEEASRDAAQGASRDPSLLACPPEGREEEEEEASGRKISEEVPARGEVATAVGSAPEGREEHFRSL